VVAQRGGAWGCERRLAPQTRQLDLWRDAQAQNKQIITIITIIIIIFSLKAQAGCSMIKARSPPSYQLHDTPM
jgi:hypothetical protein